MLGDGAVWIWNIAEREYADAAHEVDWYHAKEHLHAAAEAVYPKQPDQARIWVDQQADLLYAGQALNIADHLLLLAALANPEGRAKFESEAGYFSNNHERMKYHDFQQAGLPNATPFWMVGSGTIESGAKNESLVLVCAGHVRVLKTCLPFTLPT